MVWQFKGGPIGSGRGGSFQVRQLRGFDWMVRIVLVRLVLSDLISKVVSSWMGSVWPDRVVRVGSPDGTGGSGGLGRVALVEWIGRLV